MNCPYCNNPCENPHALRTIKNPLGEYICTQCTATPEFVKWDESVFNKLNPSICNMFFEVVFFGNDYFAYYYPNDDKLYIPKLNKMFTISYTITPDNVLQTINRMCGLKIFL